MFGKRQAQTVVSRVEKNRLKEDGKTLVAHIGVMGEYPGGMAQVVNAYLSWNYDRCTLVGIKSTGGQHDPSALWRVPLCCLQLMRIAMRKQPKCAVVHLSQRGSFAREGFLAAIAKALGIPVVLHLHGSEFLQYSAKNPNTVRRVLGLASRVLVLTSETKEVVGRLHPNKTVQQVSNAVSVGHYQPIKRDAVIFGGEVGIRKGIDVLIAAWSQIGLDDRAGWQLRIAGKPTAEGKVLISNLDESIVFLGALHHSELLEELDNAAIAVLPSRNEAMPMFLLEAMAASCAPVGTDVGDVSEVVGEAGFVLEPGDRDSLAESLQSLIRDSQMRIDYGMRANLRVQSMYSAEAVGCQLERIWIDAAAEGSKAAC